MSVRWDPLTARILAREIAARWGGTRVLSLTLDRERRAAELAFEDAPSLFFLLHPEAGHVVSGEALRRAGAVTSAGPVASGEGVHSADAPAGHEGPDEEAGLPGERTGFRRLFLGEVEAPPDERLLLLELADAAGRRRHRVAAELHTNQWNLLLLAPDGEAERILAALWPREAGERVLRPGRPYAPPAGSRAGRDGPLSRDEWTELLASIPPERRRRTALHEIAWLSSVNVEWVLGPAAELPGAEGAETDGATGPADADALAEAHARYLELWEGLPPEPGRAAFLLERPWGPQPYPLRLEADDPESWPSLLDALGEAARRDGAGDRFLDEEEAAAARREERAERLREALLERRKRLERKRAALERERGRGADPEALRELGNLLLARLGDVPRGADRAELEGFDGDPREVELDPTLGPAENAEAYFEEAARRERALERIPEELGRAARELERVDRALARLDEEGPSEELWAAAGGRPGEEGGRGEDEERLPYLRLRTSGGREVRVGRNARSNDELTFHHSSPEDIWLHARQVQGAHVILRWGHREGNPPRRDLLEAAVAAAVHSGARHSGTVAVDWTRRKYVRSPRKAPPGAVIPDRVQTVFVEPDAELAERMKRRARTGAEA